MNRGAVGRGSCRAAVIPTLTRLATRLALPGSRPPSRSKRTRPLPMERLLEAALAGMVAGGARTGLQDVRASDPLMNVIVDLCLIPLGTGTSLSPYVAACERILEDAGLKTVLHANGTNIEGEWDAVFAAIKRCHEVTHELGRRRSRGVYRLYSRGVDHLE